MQNNSLDDRNALYEKFASAAHRGELATVLQMLAEGTVHVDGCDTPQKYDRKSALYEASRAGHLSIVQALIKAGANVNLSLWPYYGTVLHAACSFGQSVEVVEALLDAGADVHERRWSDQTALNEILNAKDVSRENKINILRLLLPRAKRNVNVAFNGNSSLYYVFIKNTSSDTLPSGANVTKRNRVGMTALQFFIKNSAPVNFIRMTLEHGANVNAKRDPDERTALHMAAELTDVETFCLLIEYNADVLVQDKSKRTVLMDLLRVPESKIEQALLMIWLILAQLNVSNTSYLNLQDEHGWTALHHATALGCCSAIQELLCWKPGLTCKTIYEGSTALHHLYWSTDGSSRERLQKFRCLAEHQNGYHSDKVNIQDLRGRTVLHLAVEKNYVGDDPFLEYLSSVVDVSIADEKGATALHTALKSNTSQAVISALLGSPQGAQAANLRNGEGKTALHDAIVQKKIDAARAIARIADVNVADYEGKTALHYAIMLDEPSFLYLLLQENANPSLRDHQGHTPLALACMRNTCYNESQLSMIYHLYQYGVAYGNLQGML